MAVMTEARLRKIVREELKRRLRESYDPFYDTEMGDEREWVGTPGEEWYDTTMGDDEEWVEDADEEEEGEGGSAGEWNPWTGKVQYRDPVTGQIELDERRRRLLRRR